MLAIAKRDGLERAALAHEEAREEEEAWMAAPDKVLFERQRAGRRMRKEYAATLIQRTFRKFLQGRRFEEAVSDMASYYNRLMAAIGGGAVADNGGGADGGAGGAEDEALMDQIVSEASAGTETNRA